MARGTQITEYVLECRVCKQPGILLSLTLRIQYGDSDCKVEYFIMNVANFIEEFTKLIIRSTSTPSPRNDVSGLTPLTPEILFSSMQQVLQATLGINVSIVVDTSIKTPAVGIVVNTPDAPIVPKINYEQDNDSIIHTSYDSLSSKFKKIDDSSAYSPCDAKDEIQKEPTDYSKSSTLGNQLSNETKYISRSSPAVYISSVGRSDTFTRETPAVNDDETFKDKDFLKIESDFADVHEKLLDPSFMQTLELLRNNSLQIATTIDELYKHWKHKTVRPIRRLSSVTGFPGLSRSSTTMRTIPPPKTRRSVSSVLPGTPTSSRQDFGKLQPLKRAKSTSSSSLNVTSSTKLSVPPKNNLSNLSIDKSPVIEKPAKNPKYAHVQSTIPKLGGTIKRKS